MLRKVDYLSIELVRGAFLLCILAVLQVACVSEAGFLTERQARHWPRGRIACLPSTTAGAHFPDPDHLGSHGYRFSLSEGNGIVYTCKAGHVDITHLRKMADWTACLASRTLDKLKNKKTDFTFRLREPARYYVELTYPDYWDGLPEEERDRICREIAIELGRYFAHTASVWHEIITWFGYRSIGIIPEFPSAFSWEDSFSDLLGTYVGVMAMRDTSRGFDEAVTFALDRELEKLGVQSKATTLRVTRKLRGKWFTGEFFMVDMKKRNFDVGLDDGFITPWVVPNVAGCGGVEPQSYRVPTADILGEYGFSMKFELRPSGWEHGRILKIAYPDRSRRESRIDPEVHFPIIMAHIEEQAIRKYGPEVCSYYTRIECDDVNGDCRVNFDDLALLTSDWLDDSVLKQLEDLPEPNEVDYLSMSQPAIDAAQ